jgi:hypothetical protein
MPPPFDDDVVSPELALVDPELAARARDGALPDLALHRLAAAAAAGDVDDALPRSTLRGLRGRVPVTPVLTLLAIATVSLVVTSLTGPDSAHGEAPTVSARSSPSSGTGHAPNGGNATVHTSAASRTPAAAPVKRASRSQGPRFASTATTLVWHRSPRATSYEVELLRGDAVIFTSTSPSSQVVLPTSWQRGGKSYSIHPEDRAFVWPVVNGRRGERPVVSGALALDLSPVVRFFELDRD